MKQYPCIVADSICESHILSASMGVFIMGTELQQMKERYKMTLWADRISECRNSGQSVKLWCKGNGLCEQTYYRCQKRIFEFAKVQQAIPFVDVTPAQPVRSGNVVITVHITGMEADIHSGADAAAV